LGVGDRTGMAMRAEVPARGPVLAVGLACALAVLAAAGIGVAASGRPLAYFTRDPSAAVRLDGCEGLSCSYAGMVSGVGVALWLATAALTLAGGLLARRLAAPAGLTALLLLGGALTAVLGIDDLFQVHEYALPAVLPSGEDVAYAAYGVAALAFLITQRRALMRTDAWILLAAGVLLLVSAGVDRIGGGHLLEDGAKLVGIVLWSVYFVGTAAATLLPALPPRPSR